MITGSSDSESDYVSSDSSDNSMSESDSGDEGEEEEDTPYSWLEPDDEQIFVGQMKSIRKLLKDVQTVQ